MLTEAWGASPKLKQVPKGEFKTYPWDNLKCLEAMSFIKDHPLQHHLEDASLEVETLQVSLEGVRTPAHEA